MFLLLLVFNIFVEELINVIKKRKKEVYRYLKSGCKVIIICLYKKLF